MKKAGIWLDKKEASIITLEGKGHQYKMIASEVVTRERIEGETKKFGKFGEQYLDAEKDKESQMKSQISKYLKELIKEIQQVDEVVIFGPADMKNLLEKQIIADVSLATKLKAVETADSMTENQKVAWVRDFYDN